MRIFIKVLIVAAILAGCVYFWQRTTENNNAAAPDSSLATVTRGNISQTVACTGRVVSNLDVDIKCKASGRIQKLPVEVSDRVKEGELLMELDPVDENRAVAKAEAQLAQAQAQLAQARQELLVAESDLKTSREKAQANLLAAQAHVKETRAKADRRKALLKQGLGSQEDYDAAESAAVQDETDLRNAQIAVEETHAKELALESRRQEVKLVEAQVQGLAISLSDARQRLADTRVTAPIDGVVATRNVQIGTIISSGITNVGGGTTVMVLSDLSRIFVLGSVDESDVGQIKLGQDVILTADAYKGMKFKGKVVRIATRGVNISNVITFEVKIEIVDGKKNLLKPEMTSNVEIVIDRKKNTLLVPIGAVKRRDDEDGGYAVMVPVQEGEPQERPVEVGINDGNCWEILKGVNEKESVVVRKQELDSRWKNEMSKWAKSSGMFGGGRRH